MRGLFSHVLWEQPWGSEAEEALRSALESLGCQLHELSSQDWDPETGTIGAVHNMEVSYLSSSAARWSSIILHAGSLVAEPLALRLSSQSGKAVLLLYEYDQSVWGYRLYEAGELRDRFWNEPGELLEEATASAGDAAALSRVFRVPPESVTPYLRHISQADQEIKAFDDDEFCLGDHWVRCDFMRRLGLSYPGFDEPDGRYVQISEPDGSWPSPIRDVREFVSNPASSRPWWKFW